jgi:transposase
MQSITTIGLDIAKSVFQVHGVDAEGNVILRRQLKRRYVLAFFQKVPPCLVGIEACASSHHWSRELKTLGHTVRLMPPAYVKPYVKRQKNDTADAEAICEAVTRANMRFVATKTPEQQSGLMLHRTRHLFIRQQTAVINAIRAHLAEFGVVAPVGRIVEGDLPSEYRVGIFREARTFAAWVRFSNGSGVVQRDIVPDGRGMAIKLMGVDGRKLLADEPDAATKDFLLINHDVFFVKDAKDCVELFRIAERDGAPTRFFLGLNPFKWRLKEFANARKTRSQIAHPFSPSTGAWCRS